ncbi:hypothetical protein RDI58_028261 [Solanum bulbocastanum]|uniref:Reverse transcriptase zinc-binding domain-containing protein n=1 Tax=Solanum bulbocastanum TaxID=147425 RepID=A0AAN8Y0Z3_SOLBU
MYYGKQWTVWNIQANQASWMMQKILQVYKDLEAVGWNEAQVIQVYQLLRGEYPKVEWRKLVCNTIACPKWCFILLLTLHGRLLTNEWLIVWGSVDNTKCIL